jgi:hypothetical protein
VRVFPTFKVHEEARCFLCNKPLSGEVHATEFPSGRFKQCCNSCGMSTYYDLDPFKPSGSGVEAPQ